MVLHVTDYLVKEMNDEIVGTNLYYHATHIPHGIILLTKEMAIRENYVYISDRKTFEFVLSNNQVDGAYVFLTEDGENGDMPFCDTVTCFQTNQPLIPLYNHLQNILGRMGTVLHAKASATESFADFLYDVIVMEVTRYDEIVNRFNQYPNTRPGEVYRVIVFEFDKEMKTMIDKSRFLNGLQQLFPYSNASFYFDRVIMIAQGNVVYPESATLPEEKMIELQQMCEQYHAYCGISNETKNMAVIRTEYLHCKAIIKIGKHLPDEKGNRVFTQENYFAYLMMDLCFREFSRTYHHNNYLYMLHPGLSEVVRYDHEHHTNLREILYCYLMNDRNLTKTATLMYMHRNTIIYKVDKAVGLLGDNIDDPIIRQRVLWSCMMCEYCEKVLDLPPMPFPR